MRTLIVSLFAVILALVGACHSKKRGGLEAAKFDLQFDSAIAFGKGGANIWNARAGTRHDLEVQLHPDIRIRYRLSDERLSFATIFVPPGAMLTDPTKHPWIFYPGTVATRLIRYSATEVAPASEWRMVNVVVDPQTNSTEYLLKTLDAATLLTAGYVGDLFLLENASGGRIKFDQEAVNGALQARETVNLRKRVRWAEQLGDRWFGSHRTGNTALNATLGPRSLPVMIRLFQGLNGSLAHAMRSLPPSSVSVVSFYSVLGSVVTPPAREDLLQISVNSAGIMRAILESRDVQEKPGLLPADVVGAIAASSVGMNRIALSLISSVLTEHATIGASRFGGAVTAINPLLNFTEECLRIHFVEFGMGDLYGDFADSGSRSIEQITALRDLAAKLRTGFEDGLVPANGLKSTELGLRGVIELDNSRYTVAAEVIPAAREKTLTLKIVGSDGFFHEEKATTRQGKVRFKPVAAPTAGIHVHLLYIIPSSSEDGRAMVYGWIN